MAQLAVGFVSEADQIKTRFIVWNNALNKLQQSVRGEYNLFAGGDAIVFWDKLFGAYTLILRSPKDRLNFFLALKSCLASILPEGVQNFKDVSQEMQRLEYYSFPPGKIIHDIWLIWGRMDRVFRPKDVIQHSRRFQELLQGCMVVNFLSKLEPLASGFIIQLIEHEYQKKVMSTSAAAIASAPAPAASEGKQEAKQLVKVNVVWPIPMNYPPYPGGQQRSIFGLPLVPDKFSEAAPASSAYSATPAIASAPQPPLGGGAGLPHRQHPLHLPRRADLPELRGRLIRPSQPPILPDSSRYRMVSGPTQRYYRQII